MESNRKDFSKMVTTENGDEARIHCWKDEWGVHITLDFKNEDAWNALDNALSTKCMSLEQYEETIELLEEILSGS